MGENHPPYRSPIGLSRLATVGIGVDGLLGLLDVVVGAGWVLAPDRLLDLGDAGQMSVWLMIVGLVSLLQFPVYVFAVVTFLMWLYRTYTNLPSLRSDSTEFTPAWAVGWWFIPIANLFKPFQAVRSVWSESDPDIDPNFGFLSKTQSGAPMFMAFWWATWLLSNVTSNIAGKLFDPDDQRTFEIAGYGWMVSGVLTAIAAALAVKVIYEITDRQEQRFINVGVVQTSTPPPPPPSFDQNDQQ